MSWKLLNERISNYNNQIVYRVTRSSEKLNSKQRKVIDFPNIQIVS